MAARLLNETGQNFFPFVEGAHGAILMWDPMTSFNFLKDYHRLFLSTFQGDWNPASNRDVVPPYVIVANKVGEPEDVDGEMLATFEQYATGKRGKGFRKKVAKDVNQDLVDHIHMSVKEGRDVLKPLLVLLRKFKGADDLEITRVEREYVLNGN